MTNSSCGIKNKWCWKKNFFTPEFVQWLPVRLSLFLLNFPLLERLCVKPVTYFSTAETHLQLIVVAMQLSYFFFQMTETKRCFFFSSSGNISVFPSLLQQSDDSNCILLPIQHITYNFYHLFFFISRFVCFRSSLFHVVSFAGSMCLYNVHNRCVLCEKY